MVKNVIHIFGASGSGTTTLGAKLCDELGYKLLDADDYFWLPTNPPYIQKRSKEERLKLIKNDIERFQNVVISGSIVDWGDELIPLFTLAIRIEMNQALRIYQIFVACDGDKVVGYIGCVNYLAFEFENEGMKIIALAVSKEYRRKGNGTQLLKTAEQWAKENNIEVVLLNSGLPREDAHTFYELQGYFKKSYGFIKRV